MSISFLAFVGSALFMIHEFDEIVFVRVWLASSRAKERPNLWTRGGDKNYPSTAVIALEIAEEYLLVFLVCLIAILGNFAGLLLGLLIVNCLHLCGHLVDALRTRFWTPGSPTAAVTLIANFILLGLFFISKPPQNLWNVLLGIVLAAIIFTFNLLFIHKLATKLKEVLDRLYQ